MPKHQEAAVSKASAWAEAVGYVANICLSMHKLQQLSLQEQQLLKKVQQHCRVRWMSREDGNCPECSCCSIKELVWDCKDQTMLSFLWAAR